MAKKSGGLAAGLEFLNRFAFGGDPQVMTALETDPELGGDAEITAQAPSSVAWGIRRTGWKPKRTLSLSGAREPLNK
jgi:hypothetical protein